VKKIICTAVTVLFILVGMSACTPAQGYVTGKQVVPTHTETDSVPTYIETCSYNYNLKMTTCQQQLIGFHDETYTIPTKYCVTFKDNENKTHTDCTSPERYRAAKVGQLYTEE